MNHPRIVGFVTLVLTVLAIPAVAGKPAPAEKPPSAMIFGTFNAGITPENLWFRTGTETFQRAITVPEEGAWFFTKRGVGSWPDCDHHYEATLTPTNGGYDPFYILGATDADICVGSNCYSCTLNFNGVKPWTYLTSKEFPGYLPAGTYTVTLRPWSGSAPGDSIDHNLAQVNQGLFESVSIYQSIGAMDPTPAQQAVIDGQFFIGGVGDSVPVVPVFKYGSWEFPGGPNIEYAALWDASTVETLVERRDPKVLNGHATLLVSVPRLTTGTHKFQLVTKLPGGKTLISPAMSVFVFDVDIETTVKGTATFNPAVTVTKGDSPSFHVVQRDGGRALDIVEVAWAFGSIGLNPQHTSTGAGDPSLATDRTTWAGDMVHSGTLKAKIKVQAGRVIREAHLPLVRTIIVQPRAGIEWDLRLNLAEDTFDDLGAANGGDLKGGFFFPSTKNLNAWAAIGKPKGWTTGVTGDARSYHTGVFNDNTGDLVFQPRRYTASLPLYRPFGRYNDPDDFPSRYIVRHVPTGPWRGFFYVTEQHVKIDRLWLTISYLKDGSAIGQDPTKYHSFQLKTGCTNTADPACYEPVPISLGCWTQLFGSSSIGYADASRSKGFDIGAMQRQVRDHEPRVHWRQTILDLLANQPAKWDVARNLERRLFAPNPNATEASVQFLIDDEIRKLTDEWVLAPDGGQWDVKEPFISTMILDDASGTCGYTWTTP